MRTRHMQRALLAVAMLAVAAAVLAAATPTAEKNAYVQHNLVSDGFLPADHTDTHLVNAWGLTSLPGSPWWVADNGTDVSTLYTADGTPRPLYVGRRWVHDDEHESLVVNWQAPAARPFYTATPQTPHGVQQRRRFRAEGRRLTDISDESLDGSAVEGASVSDFLLEELERRRDVRMRDIVATIQSDQYRLITAEPEGALVVQGGPGTGKTAVGLHRASWLLYTHREHLRRVLVVGPNPTFMDYVSHVLPTLGEEAVEQRAVTELLDGIEAVREEEPCGLGVARVNSRHQRRLTRQQRLVRIRVRLEEKRDQRAIAVRGGDGQRGGAVVVRRVDARLRADEERGELHIIAFHGEHQRRGTVGLSAVDVAVVAQQLADRGSIASGHRIEQARVRSRHARRGDGQRDRDEAGSDRFHRATRPVLSPKRSMSTPSLSSSVRYRFAIGVSSGYRT